MGKSPPAAKDWDTFGVPKDQAEYFLRGGKYPEAEYRLAEQTRDRCLADPEFMERWRGGDPRAKRMAWAWSDFPSSGFDSNTQRRTRCCRAALAVQFYFVQATKSRDQY
jgi:hypothetical protein